MRKNVLFAALLLTVAATAYGQDGVPVVKKSLTAYACGGTGNISPNSGSNVLDSWGEFGMTYSQNFANAQWLRINTTIAIESGIAGLLYVNGTPDNGGSSIGVPENTTFSGYGKIELGFDKYFALGLTSRGRMDWAFKYSKTFANIHNFYTEVYFELYPTGNSFYATVGDPALTTRTVLPFLHYRLQYGVAFNPEWSFATDLRFRFSGAVREGSTATADSALALAQSFNVRWNNTIFYNNPNGFGAYVQLRYQPTQLVKVGDSKVKHDVFINTGISYSYNLSAL